MFTVSLMNAFERRGENHRIDTQIDMVCKINSVETLGLSIENN